MFFAPDRLHDGLSVITRSFHQGQGVKWVFTCEVRNWSRDRIHRIHRIHRSRDQLISVISLEWPSDQSKRFEGVFSRNSSIKDQGTSRHHWHLSQYWHSQDASGGHMAYHSAQPCLALNNWSLCNSKLRLNTYPSKLHFVLLQSCFWVFIRP